MLALRVVVGALGLLALLLAARIWVDPAAAAAQFGLLVNGELGQASLRADFAGLFAATGGLALLGPICLLGAALAGRLLNLVMAGFTFNQLTPILVEVLSLAILGAGFRGLRKPDAAV